MWSVGVILTFFDDLKTFLTLLTIELSQFFLKLPNFLFFFSFIPIYCVSTLIFCKGGAISQSADTADADADADDDKDVDVVLDSLCFA